MINDVNSRLSDLVQSLEDQGASLRIRPIPEKFLAYEIQCPVSPQDDQYDGPYMDQNDQNQALNTLKRHELQVELLGVPQLESQKLRQRVKDANKTVKVKLHLSGETLFVRYGGGFVNFLEYLQRK